MADPSPPAPLPTGEGSLSFRTGHIKFNCCRAIQLPTGEGSLSFRTGHIKFNCCRAIQLPTGEGSLSFRTAKAEVIICRRVGVGAAAICRTHLFVFIKPTAAARHAKFFAIER